MIGDSVNKTSRVCSLTTPNKVSVSKETLKHLELYTNNYAFNKTFVEMKGIGLEPIYHVSHMKGKTRSQIEKFKSFDGKLTSSEMPSASNYNNDVFNEDDGQTAALKDGNDKNS